MSQTLLEAPPSPAGWPTVATGRPVLVVGPNPATDRLQVIPHLQPGSVHRAVDVEAKAGGKSFIVSRTIRRRGVDVSMYGFIGGEAKRLAEAEQAELHITNRHTEIGRETRMTTVVVEQDSGRSTVINEPGPAISAEELAQFEATLVADVQPGDLMVCTGSLPRGIRTDLYARVVTRTRSKKVRVMVDASGEVLVSALEQCPWLVKCNALEFAAAHGLDIPDEGSLVAAMKDQCRRGTSAVIVTMGGDSFLIATVDGVWKANVPQVDVVNATGSGDTFLGCLVAAAAKGHSFVEALRDAAAGGSINAAQLEPGLQHETDLEPFRSTVGFMRV